MLFLCYGSKFEKKNLVNFVHLNFCTALFCGLVIFVGAIWQAGWSEASTNPHAKQPSTISPLTYIPLLPHANDVFLPLPPPGGLLHCCCAPALLLPLRLQLDAVRGCDDVYAAGEGVRGT